MLNQQNISPESANNHAGQGERAALTPKDDKTAKANAQRKLTRMTLKGLNHCRAGDRDATRRFRQDVYAAMQKAGKDVGIYEDAVIHRCCLAFIQVRRFQGILAQCDKEAKTDARGLSRPIGITMFEEKRIDANTVLKKQIGITIEQYMAVNDRLLRAAKTVEEGLLLLGLDMQQLGSGYDQFLRRQPMMIPNQSDDEAGDAQTNGAASEPAQDPGDEIQTGDGP